MLIAAEVVHINPYPDAVPEEIEPKPAGWYNRQGVTSWWNGSSWEGVGAPAGWYPVPGGTRWWDGHSWTDWFGAENGDAYQTNEDGERTAPGSEQERGVDSRAFVIDAPTPPPGATPGSRGNGGRVFGGWQAWSRTTLLGLAGGLTAALGLVCCCGGLFLAGGWKSDEYRAGERVGEDARWSIPAADVRLYCESAATLDYNLSEFSSGYDDFVEGCMDGAG